MNDVNNMFHVNMDVEASCIGAHQRHHFHFSFCTAYTSLTAFGQRRKALEIHRRIINFDRVVRNADGCGQAVFQCVFRTSFVLLAFEQYRGVAVLPGLQEEFGQFTVTRMEYCAVVGRMIGAAAPNGLFIVAFVNHPDGTIGEFLVYPIVAATRNSRRFVPLHLVLGVGTHLFLLVRGTMETKIYQVFNVRIRVNVRQVMRVRR